MIYLGVLPLINRPTRISSHSATLIDHLYTNNISVNSLSGILITDISDHFAIFHINYNIDSIQGMSHTVQRRITNTDNMNDFCNSLNNHDFSNVYNSQCPNEAYDSFIDFYCTSFENTCPIKTIKLTQKYIKRDPWITSGIIKSAKTKAKLFKNKLRTPTEININKYKTYLRTFNVIKRAAKKLYYNNIIYQFKNNIKKTWSVLNTLMMRKKSRPTLPSFFNIDNKKIVDSNQIANEFNSYFVNVGKHLFDQIPQSTKHFSNYIVSRVNQSMFLDPVHPVNIISICNKLKSKKSCGYDGLSTLIVKQTINYIAEPLAHIFNLSFVAGIVPSKLKIAEIIPIHKQGSEFSFQNYRPISLLPVFSKILEKIIAHKLVQFMECQNVLFHHQYGFRKNHSTFHPMLHLLKYIAESNNNNNTSKNPTVAIFLDLSKAFDTISHDILLKKLEFYGIRGLCNEWFASYLSNRTQFLKVNDYKSTSQCINYGVPQGSILGPILFLLYINDINNSCNLNILSFADDTTIYKSGSNINELINCINTELTKVYDWLCSNKLSLNINKTKFMIFSPSGQVFDCSHQIQINSVPLQQINGKPGGNELKFLGVCFDQHLTWKTHINYIGNKILKAIFIINRVKNSLPRYTLKTLYFTLIQSHLMYGIHVWGNACQTTLNRLILLQKRALRIINNKPYRYPTEDLFKQDNILKVRDLYKVQVSLFMYDFKYNKLPKSFNSFFLSRPHISRSTRQSNQFYINRQRTLFAQQLPNYNFPFIWNNLPENIKLKENRTVFKKEIKQLFC